MPSFLRALDRRGAFAGLAAMAVVALCILAGSRGLRDYDPALLAYTFGVLFSAFAIAYRYAVWLQRPPTAVYWRRGWRLLLTRGRRLANILFLVGLVADQFGAQRFIHRRSPRRWFAHFCFAWGTLIASAVTFPLVFGWVHFDTNPADASRYRVVLFGYAVREFPVASLERWLVFNLLNIAAVLVIVGVGLALRRRLKDATAQARQQFGNDLLPLILLLAIAVTGLMLTFCTLAMNGQGYLFLSLVHAMTVIMTLLYLPFGKLFHIFQRPAQLSVAFYKRANLERRARCRSCDEAFAGEMHIGDLQDVLAQTGYDFDEAAPGVHFQEICPACRRKLLGLAQGRAMVVGSNPVVAAGARAIRQMSVDDFL